MSFSASWTISVLVQHRHGVKAGYRCYEKSAILVSFRFDFPRWERPAGKEKWTQGRSRPALESGPLQTIHLNHRAESLGQIQTRLSAE
jgi:hypothetical protein